MKTGISPDSAYTEPVEVPALQSACTETVEVSDNKLVQIIYCQSLSLYFIQMKVEIKHKGIVYVHQQKYSIGDLIRRLR